MQWNKFLSNTAIWTAIIFFEAITLRLILVLINREANDDHIEVMTRIVRGLSLDKDSCWECFQPKLYHALGAVFIKLFSLETTVDIILLAQFISFIAGIGTLVLVWRFLKFYTYKKITQNLVFALIAFNPKLIGMNAQATNDSFVIFFGVLAFYMLLKYFHTGRLSHFIMLTLTAILAALSKGNGIVVFMACFIVFVAQIVGLYHNKAIFKKRVVLFIIFNVIFFSAMVLFSSYYKHYKEYGDPFVINWPKSPAPKLFEKTYDQSFRPGILSIVDGYFTFHFMDLLKNPYNTHGHTDYPVHRTSFWSQLYGGAHSIHFEQVPFSWEDKGILTLYITRLILILALLPTFLMCTGLIVNIKRMLKSIFYNKFEYFHQFDEWIYFVYFSLYIAMVYHYSYPWRDYSHMRAFFIYPALLCIGKYAIDGMELMQQRINSNSIGKVLAFFIFFLALLYISDVLILINRLFPNLYNLVIYASFINL